MQLLFLYNRLTAIIKKSHNIIILYLLRTNYNVNTSADIAEIFNIELALSNSVSVAISKSYNGLLNKEQQEELCASYCEDKLENSIRSNIANITNGTIIVPTPKHSASKENIEKTLNFLKEKGFSVKVAHLKEVDNSEIIEMGKDGSYHLTDPKLFSDHTKTLLDLSIKYGDDENIKIDDIEGLEYELNNNETIMEEFINSIINASKEREEDIQETSKYLSEKLGIEVFEYDYESLVNEIEANSSKNLASIGTSLDNLNIELDIDNLSSTEEDTKEILPEQGVVLEKK